MRHNKSGDRKRKSQGGQNGDRQRKREGWQNGDRQRKREGVCQADEPAIGSLWCTRAVGTIPVSDAPRRWSDCTIPPLADADPCRLPTPLPPSCRPPVAAPATGIECTPDWKLPNP